MRETKIIELLKTMQGTKSQIEFAKEIGISAPYLSDIYHGNRAPGVKVLRKLGLQKNVEYVKVSR
jgi:transcriptional regulator with XRE-family HTH domain